MKNKKAKVLNKTDHYCAALILFAFSFVAVARITHYRQKCAFFQQQDQDPFKKKKKSACVGTADKHRARIRVITPYLLICKEYNLFRLKEAFLISCVSAEPFRNSRHFLFDLITPSKYL